MPATNYIAVSGDLLGMICNGFMKYSLMLSLQGKNQESMIYKSMAERYSALIDSLWWDEKENDFHGFYRSDGKFLKGGAGQSEFLLWYDVIRDTDRIVKSLKKLSDTQVEVLSYLPALFYRYGYDSLAYDYLKRIYADKRRDYPEASSGVIEGIVRGLFGIEPEAGKNMITTCSHLTGVTSWAGIKNVPLFSGRISVVHQSDRKTSFSNESDRKVIWRAVFKGKSKVILVDGKPLKSSVFRDSAGNYYSHVDVTVPGLSEHNAEKGD